MQMHLYFSIISRALPIFTAWGLFFSLLLSCQQYVLAVGASAVPWHDSLDAVAGPRSAPVLGLCSAPQLTRTSSPAHGSVTHSRTLRPRKSKISQNPVLTMQHLCTMPEHSHVGMGWSCERCFAFSSTAACWYQGLSWVSPHRVPP